MASMKGIDISAWQKNIDLSKVKFDFVICKATEGKNYVDSYCDDFIKQAQKLKKPFGFYHFARPEINSAEDEALYFYKHTKGYFGKGIPVLDWESSGKSNVKWAKKWLDKIYDLSGVKAMIYMSESVVNSYNWKSVADAGHGLWVAKYRDYDKDYNYDMTKAGSKPSVKYWSFYAMWQWTSSGKLSGYDGNLDCDVFYGDSKLWKQYAAKTKKTAAAKDPLKKYTNEQLAEKVLKGEFGNGSDRKKALGDRYDAVQKIVDQKLSKKTQSTKKYYTVKKGDTLSGIAAMYGVNWHDLAKPNNLKNPSVLRIGQKIRIK